MKNYFLVFLLMNLFSCEKDFSKQLMRSQMDYNRKLDNYSMSKRQIEIIYKTRNCILENHFNIKEFKNDTLFLIEFFDPISSTTSSLFWTRRTNSNQYWDFSRCEKIEFSEDQIFRIDLIRDISNLKLDKLFYDPRILGGSKKILSIIVIKNGKVNKTIHKFFNNLL